MCFFLMYVCFFATSSIGICKLALRMEGGGMCFVNVRMENRLIIL